MKEAPHKLNFIMPLLFEAEDFISLGSFSLCSENNSTLLIFKKLGYSFHFKTFSSTILCNQIESINLLVSGGYLKPNQSMKGNIMD